MSRFIKASQVIWHCQYHLVWVPKYRFRILKGPVAREVPQCVMLFCQRLDVQVVELNVQQDHVHLLVKIPPKLSVWELVGVLKGRIAIRICNLFAYLKRKPFWGNHFWSKGYCVDTVGLNAEMIKKCVKYQERQEQHQRELELGRASEPSQKGR